MNIIRSIVLIVSITLTLSADDSIIRIEKSKSPDRGPNFSKIEYRVAFPNASFWHQATLEEGKETAVTGKYGDHFFGLDFGRNGNGGWNLWKFLSVTVNVGGKIFDGTASYPLSDVMLLEKSPRTMVDFIWALASSQSETAPPPRLLMRAIQFPSHRQWLFIRLTLEGDALWEKIGLSCFPGNTSGPATRERCVMTENANFNMHRGSAEIPAGNSALFFYNQYAQTDYGCLLIYEREKMSSVKVAGTYGVNADFYPFRTAEGIVFALGYFREIKFDKAATMFFGEEEDQIRSFMKTIDWTPRFSYDETEGLIADVKEILRTNSFWPEIISDSPAPQDSKTISDNFYKAEKDYDKAKLENDYPQITRLSDQIREIKKLLISNAMAQLKK